MAIQQYAHVLATDAEMLGNLGHGHGIGIEAGPLQPRAAVDEQRGGNLERHEWSLLHLCASKQFVSREGRGGSKNAKSIPPVRPDLIWAFAFLRGAAHEREPNPGSSPE